MTRLKYLSVSLAVAALLALGFVAARPPAHAQGAYQLASDMGCPASVSSGAPISLLGVRAINVLLGGTFSATVRLEAANTSTTPVAADWVPYGAQAVSGLPTATAPGNYTFYGDAPPLWLRCTTTVYASGTPVMRLGRQL